MLLIIAVTPFLLQTICQKTPKDSAQYEDCKRALQGVSKVCALRDSTRNDSFSGLYVFLNFTVMHILYMLCLRSLASDTGGWELITSYLKLYSIIRACRS